MKYCDEPLRYEECKECPEPIHKDVYCEPCYKHNKLANIRAKVLSLHDICETMDKMYFKINLKQILTLIDDYENII